MSILKSSPATKLWRKTEQGPIPGPDKIAMTTMSHAMSLPNLRPKLAHIDGHAQNIKCKGEFCNTPKSQLGGLYRGKFLAHPNNEDHPNDIVNIDTGDRIRISNMNIMLAHEQLQFLVRNASSTETEKERKQWQLKWQELDATLRMEFGRSNPAQYYKQVSVCANCANIYNDISRLRDCGFDDSLLTKTEKVKKKKGSKRGKLTGKQVHTTLKYHPNLDSNEIEFPDEPIGYDPAISTALQEGDIESIHLTGNNASHDITMKNNDGYHSLPLLNNSRSSQEKSEGTKHTKQSINSIQLSSADKAKNHSAHMKCLNDDRVECAKYDKCQHFHDLSMAQSRITELSIQNHHLSQQLEKSNENYIQIIQEKEQQHKKEVMELELAQCQKSSQSISDKAHGSAYVAQLVETIESLNKQIIGMDSQKDQLTQNLTNIHRAELAKRQEAWQVETNELKKDLAKCMDSIDELMAQINSRDHEVKFTKAQLVNAKTALEDVRKTSIASLEEKNNQLRLQVGELKTQLGRASLGSKCDTFQSEQTISEAQLREVEVKFAAKIEYLKKEVASELKCKEELGQHLSQLTSTLEKMKREKKQALLEQEATFKRQIERQEAAYQQDKQMWGTQESGLQSRLLTFQANISDLMSEINVWKTKENQAKLAAEKLAEENVRLTQQVVDIETQLEELQENIDHGILSGSSVKLAQEETIRLQNESVIRKLQNENDYIHQQLENITLSKEALQRDLIFAQQELEQAKYDAEDRITNITKDFDTKKSIWDKKSEELMEKITSLEHGKNSQHFQLNSLQIKIASMKEQASEDHEIAEKWRCELINSKEQILQLQNDILKEKENIKVADERMAQAFSAVKNSLKVAEADKIREVSRIEEENRIYMLRVATAESEVSVLKDEFAKKTLKFNRAAALKYIIIRRNGARTSHDKFKLLRAFSVFIAQEKLAKLHDAMMKKNHDDLIALQEYFQKQLEEACKKAVDTCRAEHIQVLNRLKESHDSIVSQLHEKSEREQRELNGKWEKVLNSKEEDLIKQQMSIIKDLDYRHELEANAFQQKYLVAQKEAELSSTIAAALKSELKNLSKQWHEQQEMAMEEEKLRIEHAVEHEINRSSHLINNMKCAMEIERYQMLESANMEKEDMLVKTVQYTAVLLADSMATLQEQRRIEIENLQHGHEDNVVKLLKAAECAYGNQVEGIKAHWQSKIEKEKANSNAQFAQAIIELEQKHSESLVQQEIDFKEKKGSAILKCTEKWQQAMNSMQEQMNLKVQEAFLEGQKDREAEWLKAAQLIKEKQKKEFEKVERDAHRAITAAEERFALQHENSLIESRITLMKKYEDDVAQARLEIQNEFSREFKNAWDIRVEELQKRTQNDMNNLTLQLENCNEMVTEENDTKWRNLLQKKFDEMQTMHNELTQQYHNDTLSWKRKLHDVLVTGQGHERDKEALKAHIESMQIDHEKNLQNLRSQLEMQANTRLKTELLANETKLANIWSQKLNALKNDHQLVMSQELDRMQQWKSTADENVSKLQEQVTQRKDEIRQLQQDLEEAEDEAFDKSIEYQETEKRRGFYMLYTIMQAKQKINKIQTEFNLKLSLQTQLLEDSASKAAELERNWQNTWELTNKKHEEMWQILTSSYRDDLIKFRQESGVLSQELSSILNEMQDVQSKKSHLEQELEQLHKEGKNAEERIRLAVVNETGNEMNIALLTKKRRLNEDFEAILSLIEKKKDEIHALDDFIHTLRTRKEKKENEMKNVERKLVEILVLQQKQLVKLVIAIKAVITPISSASQIANEKQELKVNNRKS